MQYPDQDDKNTLNRRAFLRTALAGSAGLVVATGLSPVEAALRLTKERVLSFHNLHTGEKSRILYWANGQYQGEGFAEINQLLRDHRSGQQASMDARLMDALYLMQVRLENHHRLEVISGYRSPQTNLMLHNQDKSGVAKRSYHTRGMAIDVRLPGTRLSNLRKVALSTRAGGVGYYPRSNFLHLDTGRNRSWTG